MLFLLEVKGNKEKVLHSLATVKGIFLPSTALLKKKDVAYDYNKYWIALKGCST